MRKVVDGAANILRNKAKGAGHRRGVFPNTRFFVYEYRAHIRAVKQVIHIRGQSRQL